MPMRFACVVCGQPLDEHGQWQTNSCLDDLKSALRRTEDNYYGSENVVMKARLKLVGARLPDEPETKP